MGTSRLFRDESAMNPLTQIKNTQKATLSEVSSLAAPFPSATISTRNEVLSRHPCSICLARSSWPSSDIPPSVVVVVVPQIRLGLSEGASWHAKYKHSAYVFAGGLSFDLTEGDVLAVFSQYGEIVDVNLVRHEDTGKSRGFAFICYEDQRSTVLAVDNLNGAKVLGRIIKVDHVEDYKLKDEEAARRRDWKCGCGCDNFKFRDNCHKCGGARPMTEGADGDGGDEVKGVDAAGRWGHEGFKADERPAIVEEGAAGRAEAWEGAAFNAISKTNEEDEMIRELKARKEAAMARARAAAAGLPIPGDDPLREAKREAKRAKRERKEMKKEKKKRKKEDRRVRDDASSSSEEGQV